MLLWCGAYFMIRIYNCVCGPLVIVGFCAVREETKETPAAPYPHRKNVLGFEEPNGGPWNFISANGVFFQGGFLF